MKKKSLKKPVKASRKNPAKPGLAELIRLTNQVPDKLEDLNHLRDWASQIARDKGRSSLDVLDQLIFERVEKLQQELKEWFGPRPDMSDAQSRLEWVCAGRERLRNRYDYLTQGKAALAVIADTNRKRIGPFRFEIWAEKDDEGRFRWKAPQILECLEGIAVDRVRRCGACKKIFWAGHGNKQSCSDACGNVLRNRIYRANYLERYKIRKSS